MRVPISRNKLTREVCEGLRACPISWRPVMLAPRTALAIVGVGMMQAGHAFPWGGLPRGMKAPLAVHRTRVVALADTSSNGGALQASPRVSGAVLGAVLAAAVSTSATDLLDLQDASVADGFAGTSSPYERIQRDTLPRTTNVDVADRKDFDRLLSDFLLPSELPTIAPDSVQGVSRPTFGVDFTEEVFNPNFG